VIRAQAQFTAMPPRKWVTPSTLRPNWVLLLSQCTGERRLDSGGYLDLTPLDSASNLRRETVLTLEGMGIGSRYSHHEVAASQHEIGLPLPMLAHDGRRGNDAYRLVVQG